MFPWPSPQPDLDPDIAWEKSVCRFCGVGCGVVVGTRNGHVAAVKGDPECPVNRGLLCAKGYANANILYGADRLHKPLLRMKDGHFDKNGDFTKCPGNRPSTRWSASSNGTTRARGRPASASWAPASTRFPRVMPRSSSPRPAGERNNIDPNARHCMASAVAAFMQVYGIDEPAGCYDDIELTDTVVTWGANMAEMHPMLWARVVDHRLRNEDARVVNLTTYSNRTSECADHELIFKPQTDLAIWNYIAREIVKRGAVDTEFVDSHCVFAAGPTDIGFGMPGDDKHAFAAEARHPGSPADGDSDS